MPQRNVKERLSRVRQAIAQMADRAPGDYQRVRQAERSLELARERLESDRARMDKLQEKKRRLEERARGQ